MISSLRDRICNRRLRLSGVLSRIRQKNETRPPIRVLVVGIEVPSRKNDIHAVVKNLCAGTRHDVSISITPMGDRGKFANIDEAISAASEPLSNFDWLVITDDDITFAPGFLDDLIGLSDQADLAISQPAHAYRSHMSYSITRRQSGSLVRQTNFVEIGPLTLIRSDTFKYVIPFPESRWCYGIDLLWAEIIKKNGLRMGIVDGTPVKHLRPVANSYNIDEAIQEGKDLLTRYQIRMNRAELWSKNEVVLSAQ